MGKYRWLIAFFGLFCVETLWGQRLSFDAAGLFKIVQFTDLHYIPNDPRSDAAVRLVEEILDRESPDLVVFTGDVVTGAPVREGWDCVLAPLLRRNLPFLVTLGNHDDEQDCLEFSHNSLQEPPHTLRTRDARETNRQYEL